MKRSYVSADEFSTTYAIHSPLHTPIRVTVVININSSSSNEPDRYYLNSEIFCLQSFKKGRLVFSQKPCLSLPTTSPKLQLPAPSNKNASVEY